MIYIHETDNLGVDADGVLWKKRPGPVDVELGPIVDRPGVRPQYARELEQLREWWLEAVAGDERAEWRETYYRGLLRWG